MKKHKGFIKWYRGITENPFFMVKPFDDWRAFEYLCLKARRYPGEVVLSDGNIVHLECGQYFISRAKLADIFGWTVKKLKGWEFRMKTSKMVSAEGLPKGTRYTIENYTFYQLEGPAEGPAKGTSQGTSQGLRIKKDKESIKKDARAGVSEAPGAVVPMNDEIRFKLQKTIKGI